MLLSLVHNQCLVQLEYKRIIYNIHHRSLVGSYRPKCGFQDLPTTSRVNVLFTWKIERAICNSHQEWIPRSTHYLQSQRLVHLEIERTIYNIHQEWILRSTHYLQSQCLVHLDFKTQCLLAAFKVNAEVTFGQIKEPIYQRIEVEPQVYKQKWR